MVMVTRGALGCPAVMVAWRTPGEWMLVGPPAAGQPYPPRRVDGNRAEPMGARTRGIPSVVVLVIQS